MRFLLLCNIYCTVQNKCLLPYSRTSLFSVLFILFWLHDVSREKLIMNRADLVSYTDNQSGFENQPIQPCIHRSNYYSMSRFYHRLMIGMGLIYTFGQWIRHRTYRCCLHHKPFEYSKKYVLSPPSPSIYCCSRILSFHKLQVLLFLHYQHALQLPAILHRRASRHMNEEDWL